MPLNFLSVLDKHTSFFHLQRFHSSRNLKIKIIQTQLVRWGEFSLCPSVEFCNWRQNRNEQLGTVLLAVLPSSSLDVVRWIVSTLKMNVDLGDAGSRPATLKLNLRGRVILKRKPAISRHLIQQLQSFLHGSIFLHKGMAIPGPAHAISA